MDIKVTVEEVNHELARLRTEDGQSINWPMSDLPKDTKNGQTLVFSITQTGSHAEPEKLAKDLLNEILNLE